MVKANNQFKSTIFLFFLATSIFLSQEQGKAEKIQENLKSDSLSGNKYCLKCHGNAQYELKNIETKKIFKKSMGTSYIIDTLDFAKSNHRKFQCTNCHSDDFKTFPHSEKSRFEEVGSCIECHSGDSIAVAYKFDLIETDYMMSVHNAKHADNFNCWKCHEAHSYRVKATTIEYDNSICLSCHANIRKYNLILNKNNPNLIQKHEWLPNQQLHFQNVRCIECHSRVNDSVLVAHNVQPKSKAVKLCVECHSTNSLLRQTLYKYQSKEQISNKGFFNAVILNRSYVIGANRNYFLNVASIIILIIIFFGISIHVFLRISKR